MNAYEELVSFILPSEIFESFEVKKAPASRTSLRLFKKDGIETRFIPIQPLEPPFTTSTLPISCVLTASTRVTSHHGWRKGNRD